jgi:hypothetical protein
VGWAGLNKITGIEFRNNHTASETEFYTQANISMQNIIFKVLPNFLYRLYNLALDFFKKYIGTRHNALRPFSIIPMVHSDYLGK